MDLNLGKLLALGMMGDDNDESPSKTMSKPQPDAWRHLPDDAAMVAALAQARADALREAAKTAKCLTDAWRNSQQRHGVAFGEAIAAHILALLTADPQPPAGEAEQ